ncbi:F-box domain-containing protein [Mycena sanguinolenta]|uniref:F-box domain-containing protein n=1 Tax=Mycena sanguinolenta TaxID=230812 RepID=A0A8H6ZCV0_9AGAR|nr:F-box domain-containing protein [Mycena sanguinolenta]
MLDFMQADRTRLVDLTAKILDLERSLSALRIEQAEVQERLDAYSYHILTLPNELTSEILVRFVPVYPDAPPLTGLASPTTLTHICHRWRELALATPALWRAVKFDNNHTSEQMQYISDAWMERSGSCGLSIDIDIDDQRVLDELLLMEPSTVVDTRSRWEHLKLWVPFSHLHHFATPMPMLRSLDSAMRFSRNTAYSFKDPVFTEVPQLRTVVLYRNLIPKVTLPWTKLTSLTLNCVGKNRCARILAQTPNLVLCVLNLALYDEFGDGGLTPPEQGIVLPCLESMVLTQENRSRWSMFKGFNLDSLVVPSLRRLEVQEEFLKPNPVASLQSFISKSGCALREVCIIGDIITDLESYRGAFPSISCSHRIRSSGS